MSHLPRCHLVLHGDFVLRQDDGHPLPCEHRADGACHARDVIHHAWPFAWLDDEPEYKTWAWQRPPHAAGARLPRAKAAMS